MPEAEANPARPPRFPYVAALLCAACVGAAVWTWMSYSYCWELSPSSPAATGYAVQDYLGRYVVVRGKFCRTGQSYGWHGKRCLLVSVSSGQSAAEVLVPETRFGLPQSVEAAYSGRVVANEWQSIGSEEPHLVIDASAGRPVGASIAGLVVGAMGVFVFTVAFRHWLGERRRFLEDTRGHNNGVERTQNA